MIARMFGRMTVAHVVLGGLLVLASCSSAPKEQGPEFKESFAVDKGTLASRGAGRYFVLEPGYRLIYKHENETVTVTVLRETKVVDGVTTRVVEEREEKNGALVEVSRNYLAIDPVTRDVYYFGEEVDLYKDGKVAGHGGAWLSGVNGARFGLLMPGDPKVGQKFQQENAPGVAMDRAEITNLDGTVTTPLGEFMDCVKVTESSPLEKGVSRKVYAPGIGMVRDGELRLVKIERR